MRIPLKTRSIIIEIICLLFILLFVYAAVSKLIDVEEFAIQIGQSPILAPYTQFIVWTIPPLEIVIAVMLAIPATRIAGLFAAFGLMVVFTTYIIAILQFSHHIPCSCGGVLQGLGWKEHLVFNISFVVLALIALFMRVTGDTRELTAVKH